MLLDEVLLGTFRFKAVDCIDIVFIDSLLSHIALGGNTPELVLPLTTACTLATY